MPVHIQSIIIKVLGQIKATAIISSTCVYIFIKVLSQNLCVVMPVDTRSSTRIIILCITIDVFSVLPSIPLVAICNCRYTDGNVNGFFVNHQ